MKWRVLAGLLVGCTFVGSGLAALGAGAAGAATGVSTYARPADQAPVCGAPAPGTATCHAVQLLAPDDNWRVGPVALLPRHPTGGFLVPAPPNSGYYPVDLQSAYGWTQAASHLAPGSSAPTVAIVDAYDDPNAAADLAAYRASLSGAVDPNTALTDGALPPLCGSGTTTGCVTFTKVSQSGTTSYPTANVGWSQEISLDLDMVSAVCPSCNIVLVEANSNSLSDLAKAATEAAAFHPAAITNSYGGSEFSTETGFDGAYSASSSTAVTAATGDSGFGVEYPAADPRTTAVGGTTLTHSGTGAGLVWNAQTAWNGAGSGCSTVEPMPSWQSDAGVYSTSTVCTSRQVADVAAVADPATGVAVYDTYGTAGWTVYGGTSVSAQIIGAAYALAAGNGTLAASPSALYPDTGTAAGPTPGLVPVSSGSNGTCSNYLCNAADSLRSGYNGPTGLGTPRGIAAFTTATPATGSLTFSSGSLALVAGTPSAALTVSASAAAPAGGLAVTLGSSSSGGGFSSSAGGPFASSITLTIPAGATASPTFFYRDTAAGSSSLSATAAGWTAGTLPVSVAAGPLAGLSVAPASATVNTGGSAAFTATGRDQFGNLVAVSPSWTTTAPGTLTAASGPSTTFNAGSASGSGSVTATQGTLSASASVTVSSTPGTRVGVTAGSLSRTRSGFSIPLTVAANDASTGAALASANVTLQVVANTTCTGSASASGTGHTGSNGKVTFTFTTATARQWCALATVTATGHTPGQGQLVFTT